MWSAGGVTEGTGRSNVADWSYSAGLTPNLVTDDRSHANPVTQSRYSIVNDRITISTDVTDQISGPDLSACRIFFSLIPTAPATYNLTSYPIDQDPRFRTQSAVR